MKKKSNRININSKEPVERRHATTSRQQHRRRPNETPNEKNEQNKFQKKIRAMTFVNLHAQCRWRDAMRACARECAVDRPRSCKARQPKKQNEYKIIIVCVSVCMVLKNKNKFQLVFCKPEIRCLCWAARPRRASNEQRASCLHQRRRARCQLH